MQCANSSGFRNVFPNELFGIKNLMDCSLLPNREEGACLEKPLRDCMQNALDRGVAAQNITSLGHEMRGMTLLVRALFQLSARSRSSRCIKPDRPGNSWCAICIPVEISVQTGNSCHVSFNSSRMSDRFRQRAQLSMSGRQPRPEGKACMTRMPRQVTKNGSSGMAGSVWSPRQHSATSKPAAVAAMHGWKSPSTWSGHSALTNWRLAAGLPLPPVS